MAAHFVESQIVNACLRLVEQKSEGKGEGKDKGKGQDKGEGKGKGKVKVKVKVKVKLSLSMPWRQVGREITSTVPLILNLITRVEVYGGVHAPAGLPHRKSRWYPLKERLDGSLSSYGRSEA